MPDSTVKSLHTLSVENPRFNVHPKFWTQRHLSIVGCIFQQVEAGNEPAIVHLPGPDTERLTRYVKQFAASECGQTRNCLVHILGHDGDPIQDQRSTPKFYYGRRRVRGVASAVYVFCIRQDLIKQFDPIIGFYKYNSHNSRKKDLSAPRGLVNGPVARLMERRYWNVTPSDWRKDPYLFCLLLSLAQHRGLNVSGPELSVILTRLLVTHELDTTHAYVFKADIPHELIDCLNEPSRTIEDFAFPAVTWTKVPFEPYSTFAARIRFYLAGAEYLSSPDPIPDAAQEEQRGEKRKCDEHESTGNKAAKHA